MPERVAIITGAGSGIGRATAIMLAREGWSLALVGRRGKELRETAHLCGQGRSLAIEADIAREHAAERIIKGTLDQFGRIDALVNNAGRAPMLPIEEHTPEIIRDVYETNALAPARLIARLWPVFQAQHARGAACRGYIVNVSTLGTLDPFAGFFAYAASKASVNLMAMSCAKEGAPIGVRAFAVAPGAVETDMLRAIIPQSVIPREKTLAPEDVARVIVECLHGSRDGQSGQTITVAAD